MLNDQKAIAEIDKSGMLDTIYNFPEQIQQSVEIMENVALPDFIKIDNVIIIGMGASGISGDIVKYLFRDKIDVPLCVNREYDLPKWAKKDTLTIFISYSGNTEETLSSFKLAYQKKCKIIGISSGGKLQEFCEKRDITHIQVPGGFQPRASTAFLLYPVMSVLRRNSIIKNTIDADIAETIAVTQDLRNNNGKTVVEEENDAKQLARNLFQTIPQINGWNIYTPIACRWRTQLNENSKVIARYDVLPECNHNDIVGWSANPEVSKKWTCILFRDRHEESIYMSTRLDFIKKLFEDAVASVIEVYPKGRSRLAKMMYLMLLGDFVSCYLAVLRNVDPTPIDAIEALKNQLSER